MAKATPVGAGTKPPAVWRGWLLYLLPLPLLPAALGALGDGRIVEALACGGGLALTLAGATSIRKGIRLDRDTLRRGLRRRPSTVRYRLLGAGLAAAGMFLVAWLGIPPKHGLLDATFFAAAVLLGCYLHYDFDLSWKRPDTVAVGITTEELDELLDEAEARLQSIEAASARIRNAEFRDRLGRIVAEAREILRAIEEDPVDARRARKFLKVYLDGAEQVTAGYARAHRHDDAPQLEDNFRRVLSTIETVIGEQQQKLRENDVNDLDVKIEVLQMQLEKEGLG